MENDIKALIFNFILVLLIFVQYTSCASHIIITPRGCDTSATWGETHSTHKIEAFKYKKNYVQPMSFFYPNEILIRNELRDIGVSCKGLESLSIITSSNWLESLWGVIPVFSNRSVTFKGKYVN